MGALRDQADDIAALLRTHCNFTTVRPSIPAHVEVFSAIVSPAPEWGSFEDGTYCAPLVNWEVVIVAPFTDFRISMDWLYDRVLEMAAVDELAIQSWTQPERIDLSGVDAIAVRVALAPFTIEL